MEATLESNLLQSRPQVLPTEARAIAIAVALFAALSLAGAVTSEGFLEADACTHYFYARHALAEPHYFVNVWGRPLCTGLYAVPAAVGGLVGVRVTSLLLALVCGFVAHRLAREQGQRLPVLALVFTLAQPLLFLHSFSEMTELPFAALIGLAFWAYQRRQWAVMALLVGLSPLGRPEGFGFVLLAATALIGHRRGWPLLLLPLPLIAWNHAGWVVYGSTGSWWHWLIEEWPYETKSLYDPGSPLHFVALLPVLVSPLVFPGTVVGIWRALRPLRRHSFFQMPHLLRCRAWVALIPLMILAGHSLLYAMGKMASNGELRYLLVVAPFWGVLSARGWAWLSDRFEIRHPLRWAAAAALVPILANVAYPVVPLVLDEDWKRAEVLARVYRESGLAEDHPKVLASHPGLFYFLEISPTAHDRAVEWKKPKIAEAPAGTVVFWDSVYGVYNSDAQRSVSLDEIHQAGWLRITDQINAVAPPRTRSGHWEVFLSPRTADGESARWKPSYEKAATGPAGGDPLRRELRYP